MKEDENNLDLLSIFHYILGGITALFSCLPIIHLSLGVAMLRGAFGGKNPPPQVLGWIFVILGGTFVLCGWALAVAIIIVGSRLKRKRSRTYCIVVAALECMMMPFGTVLGVFTIIILMKESVKEIFAANNRLEGIGDPLRGSPNPQP